MTQLFSANSSAAFRLLLLGLGLALPLLLGLLFIYSRSPLATGQGSTPEQPVPFSHKHHAGALDIDCRYCHVSVEQSRFAGMPDTETCMSCHSQLWTNAEMLAPVRESLAQGQPLNWVRVHDMPDFVYFSHRAHVNNGVGCESCHGRVDRMPLMRQEKALTMRWCLDCHRDPSDALRPASAITEMGFPGNGPSEAKWLGELYDIHRERLTDCVTCHR